MYLCVLFYLLVYVNDIKPWENARTEKINQAWCGVPVIALLRGSDRRTGSLSSEINDLGGLGRRGINKQQSEEPL